ncbi:MAG: carbohydrate kinase family protein [Epsilonproteobacteria bacterium]|nr:carbohydrate kinase family protein [Campylobacterota bacterium]
MNKGNITVIGGANIEYIIKSSSDIVQGSKNFVDIEELYGGSGLNYAMRLLSAGESVSPLLYVGNDSIGKTIQSSLLHYFDKTDSIYPHVDSETFFVDGLNTIRSMIIVEGLHRTILAQDHNDQNLFLPYLKREIPKLSNITTVIIGHIHNDRADINVDHHDLSTIYAIEHFNDNQKLIYCNFGATQLAYGFRFWKGYLPKIDLLQLNIHEVKTFFTHDGKTPSLAFIIETLSELKISGIITLDKFGAIGFMPKEKNSIFMARPVDLGDEFVDSTGAGDAFCAGMVSVLNGNKNFDADKFRQAMEVARSWAVYACQSFGGANSCPSDKIISNFHKDTVKGNEVLQYCGDRMLDIVSLIDSTFEHHLL